MAGDSYVRMRRPHAQTACADCTLSLNNVQNVQKMYPKY